MFSWLRKLPTPTYGKCGGSALDCSTRPPHDPMDLAFQEHDQNCYQASLLPEDQVEEAKTEADHILHQALLEIDPSQLSFYGKLYRWACLKIFK